MNSVRGVGGAQFKSCTRASAILETVDFEDARKCIETRDVHQKSIWSWQEKNKLQEAVTGKIKPQNVLGIIIFSFDHYLQKYSTEFGKSLSFEA